MHQKKEMQERLLRYFDFGNGQELAKEKVKCLSEDMKFLGLPIGENIEKINKHIAEFNALVILSDMHIIKTIRESITFIKEKNEENPTGQKVDKNLFQTQYVEHLSQTCGSKGEAIAQLKKLGSNMKDLGCPLGEHLEGAVFGSSKLQKLYAMSMMGAIDKVLSNVNIIKGA